MGVTTDMSVADQAFITTAVFQWAIDRARSNPEKLAKKLSKPVASIRSWTRGKTRPTFGQAQKIADALHIPFGYLFLPEPPPESLPLADFRIAPGKPIRHSAELIDTVNDVLFKQEWYRAFLLERGGSQLPFVGSFSAPNNSADIAESIRSVVGLNSALRQRCKTWRDLFVTLIRQIERAGILVMRSGVAVGNTHRRLSLKEFRGFALSDATVPVIFVNSRDWPKAQLFTIAHELVHIWIGNSGVSNENLRTLDAPNSVERLCNETAAEMLVPATEFLALWSNDQKTAANVAKTASEFKVSTLVTLRRAFDLGKISRDEYFSHYAVDEQQFTDSLEISRAGGSFYNNVIARNSWTLTSTVVQGAMGGTVLYRDAGRLLNVGSSAILKIGRHIVKRQKTVP